VSNFNYKKIYIIIILLILLIFLDYNQIFKKTFFLFTRELDKREQETNGFCSLDSVGFVKFSIKNFKIQTIPKIINFKNEYGKRSIPDEYWFINKFIKKIDENYLILLNYYNQDFPNQDKNLSKFYNTKDYKVIYKFENCYLLKKI
jgi:hypothetical protein